MSNSHIHHVINNVLENIKDADNPVALVLAALFHDIGNKNCRLRKIVESEIDLEMDADRRKNLEDLAYAQRIEHMYLGILETIKIMDMVGFTSNETMSVVRLIWKHDLWKVSDYRAVGDEKLLVKADTDWMLSADGIKADQDRAVRNGLKPMGDLEQLAHNKNVIKGAF